LMRTGKLLQSTVKTGGRDKTMWSLNKLPGKGKDNVSNRR